MPNRKLIEILPHQFWPDYQAMGDCAKCGHPQDDPIHIVSTPLGADFEKVWDDNIDKLYES